MELDWILAVCEKSYLTYKMNRQYILGFVSGWVKRDGGNPAKASGALEYEDVRELCEELDAAGFDWSLDLDEASEMAEELARFGPRVSLRQFCLWAEDGCSYVDNGIQMIGTLEPPSDRRSWLHAGLAHIALDLGVPLRAPQPRQHLSETPFEVLEVRPPLLLS